MSIVGLLSDALLVAGTLFAFSGGVGLHRFPDFYARTHAAGVTDAAGAGLIFAGLALQADWDSGVRLALIFLFILLTSPTATHALAQSARRDGIEPVLHREAPGA